jgi:hypothetical protein
MSIFRGGPIDVFIIAFMKYLPFIVSGFLSMRAIIKASKFVFNLSSSKSLRPILLEMKASGLILNSIRPSLDYFTCSTI